MMGADIPNAEPIMRFFRVNQVIAARRIGAVAAIMTLLVPLALTAQVIRDSAGIQILTSPTPRDSSGLIVPDRFDLQIGVPDGSGNTDFAVVLAAKILPDGRIAVVDLQGRDIRVFDGISGRFVKSIGREGSGPGEFGAAPTIAVAEQGGLWAWDPGNRRLSLFDAGGTLVRDFALNAAQCVARRTLSP